MREPGLSDVLRRDLDRLEVPVEAVWVPAQRRRSPIRSLVALAGAAALVVAAVTGGLALRRDADVTGPVAATASPPSGTHGRSPIHHTANAASWATAHVPTTRSSRSLRVRASPRASRRRRPRRHCSSMRPVWSSSQSTTAPSPGSSSIGIAMSRRPRARTSFRWCMTRQSHDLVGRDATIRADGRCARALRDGR